MPLFSPFQLPLSQNGVPTGYEWGERDISVESSNTAFDARINERDIFLGSKCCVVCGCDIYGALERSHIIPPSETALVNLRAVCISQS